MSDRIHRILGQVVDTQGRSTANLRVEAWDKDLLFDDFVGSAVTDANGKFLIEFPEARYREWFLDRRPDLFFRVYSGAEQVADTRDTLLWNVEQGERSVTIEVELDVGTEEVPQEAGRFVVEGRVIDRAGNPLPGARVRAFDKDLRSEQRLGEATADPEGAYRITYTRKQFRRAEKRRADLIVRAFDPQTSSLRLAQSDLILNAPPVARVDLPVSHSYSEYEHYLARLKPVQQGVPTGKLTREDIRFLSKETGIDPARIEFLVQAAQLGRRTGLAPEAFYAFAREGLPTDLSDLLELDSAALETALDNALASDIVPAGLDGEREKILARLAQMAKSDPGVQGRREKRTLTELGRLSGLDDAKIGAVLERTESPLMVDDRTLADLVKSEVLREDEAKEIGLGASLYGLLDRNIELVAAFKTHTFPRIPGGRVKRIEDLAELEKPDWLDSLNESGIAPPNGLSIAQHAALLSRTVERLHPDSALWARLHADPPADPGGDGDAARRFANRFPGLGLVEILDDAQLSPEEKNKQITGRLELLARFRSQNPHAPFLSLDFSSTSSQVEGLDFDGFSQEERGRVLKTLKAYQRMYAVTHDAADTRLLLEHGLLTPLHFANMSIGQIVHETGMERTLVKSYRDRSRAIGTAMVSAMQGISDLVNGGFGGTDVSNVDPSIEDYLRNIDGWETLFGNLDYCDCPHCRSILSPAAYFVDLLRFIETNCYFEESGGSGAGAWETTAGFRAREDHPLHLRSRRLDLWRLPLTCENTLEPIPYLDIVNEVLENHIFLLLGNDREDIPDPGAIDRSIVEEPVYRALLASAASFKQPFSMPLRRLETYLAHFDLTRAEITKLLTPAMDEEGRARVAAAILRMSKGVPGDVLDDEQRCYELITEENRALDGLLGQVYGLEFGGTGEVVFHDPGLEPGEEGHDESRNDVQLLLTATELNREQFGEAIATAFVAGVSAPRIQSEKRSLDSVQNDIERIHGLTAGVLDRLHRFTRLWRQLPWSMMELDLVLGHLAAGASSIEIEPQTLHDLAAALEIQRRFGCSVEDLCALWSAVPEIPVQTGSAGLFDRLFNLPDFVRLDGELPTKSGPGFLHPAFRNTPPISGEAHHALHRLLAGLRADDGTLYQLIIQLRDPLGITDLESPDQDDRRFDLSRDNLSLLYRHARLAEWLQLTVPQLFQLIHFAGLPAPGLVGDLAGLAALLDFHDWWRSTAYSLDDLGIISSGPVTDPGNYPDPASLSGRITDRIKDDRALMFNASVFAFIEGITEEQSREIIRANPEVFAEVPGIRYRVSDEFAPDIDPITITVPDRPDGSAVPVTSEVIRDLLATYDTDSDPVFDDTLFTVIEGVTDQDSIAIVAANATLIVPAPVENVYWLSDSYAPDAALVIPEGIALTAQDAGRLLQDYHAGGIIPVYLGAELDMPVDKIEGLIGLTGEDLNDAAYTRALQTGDASGVLRDLVGSLIPLCVLFRDALFDTSALTFIDDHGDLFGPIDFSDVTTDAIRLVSAYGRFSEALKTGESADNPLHRRLSGYTDRRFFSGIADHEAQEELARVLGVETGLAVTAHEETELPENALDALAKLKRCVDLAAEIGVSGEVLSLIASNRFRELDRAANSVLGAFRAKYADEDEWREKIGPFEDRIRNSKRDALSDYLLHTLNPKGFADRNDLYHHFLIDVELDGCARTSRVVAANSSLQLYVHRVLLDLEQDRAGEYHLKLDEDAIEEWEWRRNYRVWEANRKVFLYPENYIEPDLRDNKTPLFEELESNLLQQEINEDTVLEAYAAYLRGFDEVANLKIAGSYHQKDGTKRTDTLHLFGVTLDEPPVYYYRMVDNLYYGARDDTKDERGVVWNPWQKIDVPIPVERVSPIIFGKRLFLFWTEIVTTPKNSSFKEGGSKLFSYSHAFKIKFSALNMDGSWTTPQTISLKGQHPFGHTDGVFNEELLDGVLSEETIDGQSVMAVRPKYGTENDKSLDKERGDVVQIIGEYLPNSVEAMSEIMEADLEADLGIDLDDFFDGSLDMVAQLKAALFSKTDFESCEDYTLKGNKWERIYPYIQGNGPLILTGCDFELRSAIDLYQRSTWDPGSDRSTVTGLRGVDRASFPERRLLYVREGFLHAGTLSRGIYPDPYALASLILFEGWQLFSSVRIGRLQSNTQVSPINGSLCDGLIDRYGDILYAQDDPNGGANYTVRRIGTTVSESIARKVLELGIDKALSLETVKSSYSERALPIEADDWTVTVEPDDAVGLDFTGPYGVYLREILFHVPFLIANHLNSQRKFAQAQKLYHYLFDPTAKPTGDENVPEDRNWRYIEFRTLDAKTLRQQLTDLSAIETYKRDPFNPHAIARLRMSAYQKTIVMKYIDNLLDWGDHLFAQDTMESINEATLLYVLAADILGDRPAKIGECPNPGDGSASYDDLIPLLTAHNEFLIEMFHEAHSGEEAAGEATDYHYAVMPSVMHAASRNAYTDVVAHTNMPMGESMGIAAAFPANVPEPPDETLERGNSASHQDYHGWSLSGFAHAAASFANAWANRAPVFCIPVNKDLLGYWDRVEDRLFKIRHCVNMSGVRRELSLFAPEIDPMLLVRAKAAGLSLQEVLNSISGDLPPYRFAYVIEKAKAYAAVLQGFGAALLGALEKKDVEYLSRLRVTHQQNILKMTSRIKDNELAAAEEAIQSIEQRARSIEYRRDYYQGLVDAGRIEEEDTQLNMRQAAKWFEVMGESLNLVASIGYLVPQIGSFFALTYGGQQTGAAGAMFAQMLRSGAAIANSASASAGLEAGFKRREQGWKHQVEVASHELEELASQGKIAEIRREIAERNKRVHEEYIAQQDEVFEFFQTRFTDLGLYTWLSTTLQQLFREAYNNAYEMAKLAEQAYRFERGDDAAELIGPNHWNASRAGLLAGEGLLIDLQNLERRYLETNYRGLEIDQAFSLTQIAPEALIRLKEGGDCTFDIPEVFFDLFYPGHYRRRIKAVRLTIPCVTGPYTNVSATLRLQGSLIRKEPELGEGFLRDVPRSRSVTIATSTAQNDAGVFELNFRDERYMPFEGAGAVSSWQLSLPNAFRPFDYQTINDVILHISYTAEENGELRGAVERSNAELEGTILNVLTCQSLYRAVSLRQEFSGAFHLLLHSEAETTVQISISHRHFPFFLRDESLNIERAFLVLQTPVAETDEAPPPGSQPWDGVSINLRDPSISDHGYTGITLDSFAVGETPGAPDWGRLPSATEPLTALFSDGIGTGQTVNTLLSIVAAGNLAPESLTPPDVSAIDSDKLTDIYLVLEYRLRG